MTEPARRCLCTQMSDSLVHSFSIVILSLFGVFTHCNIHFSTFTRFLQKSLVELSRSIKILAGGRHLFRGSLPRPPAVNGAARSWGCSCLSRADGSGGLPGSWAGASWQQPWLRTAVGPLPRRRARRKGAGEVWPTSAAFRSRPLGDVSLSPAGSGTRSSPGKNWDACQNGRAQPTVFMWTPPI